MIGINKYISVKVWLDSSHLENFLKHVFKMRVNWKFDFRRDWKFCWDLSNANSGGNWLFRSDCVFSGGTLYPSVNYGLYASVLGVLACMHACYDEMFYFITCLPTWCAFYQIFPKCSQDGLWISNNYHEWLRQHGLCYDINPWWSLLDFLKASKAWLSVWKARPHVLKQMLGQVFFQ